MTSQVQKHTAMPPYPRRPVVRTVKFAISICVFGVTRLWHLFARMFGIKVPGSIVGIFYHQVLPTELSTFRWQMGHLKRTAVPIRADEIPPLTAGTSTVFVTADDAWKSFADIAVPELLKHKIPCTIFAIAGRLGDNLGEADDRLVTESELQRLPSSLITIGSHTLTHPQLTSLSNAEALIELSQSREKLENLLGTEVSLFCPPFGDADERILALCRHAGYRHVYMSTLVSSSDNFKLGRIRADPSDWMLEFHLKIVGAYNWVPWSINFKASLLSRLNSLRNRTRKHPIPLHDRLEDSCAAGDIPEHPITKLG